MTAETFAELSARTAALLAKQRQLLRAIRKEQRLRTVKETQLIRVEGYPPAPAHLNPEPGRA